MPRAVIRRAFSSKGGEKEAAACPGRPEVPVKGFSSCRFFFIDSISVLELQSHLAGETSSPAGMKGDQDQPHFPPPVMRLS